MRKIIATAVSAGLLLVGGAATASAETVSRNGARTATITAHGAPEGATVTKARVTVKKGKKTVARNRTSYRAKRGTYKVTSTVTYFYPGHDTWVPGTTSTTPATSRIVPVTEADMSSEKCAVTGRTVTNRTVQVTGYDTYFREATVRGQAVITYTGNCTATFYDENFNAHPVTWVDDWTELESVLGWVKMSQAESASFDAQAWLEGELTRNSSVLYPRLVGDTVYYPGDGTELDQAGSILVTVPGQTITSPGYWTTTTPTAATTVRSTRTVVVR